MMFKKSLFCLFLLGGILHADWNQEFDQQTQMLIQELPDSKKSNYQQQHAFFIKEREKILADTSLRKKYRGAQPLDKFILNRDRLVIKKRKNDNIRDLYAWECSCLLGNTEYVVPSFPVEIEGKKVILQKKESFQHGKTYEGSYFKARRDKVSLETYWKALFIAYLLGHNDLTARNIGVNARGIIRFFDNEACFIYHNKPVKNEVSFNTGFLSQAFNWPQFRKPLDQTTASHLKSFVQSLANIENTILAYRKFRSLQFSEDDFLFRLEKVRTFSIKEGVAFRDFFGSIYPRINQGLDELKHLTHTVMKQKMGYGSSLFFISRWTNDRKLSTEQKSAVQRWLNTYIE